MDMIMIHSMMNMLMKMIKNYDVADYDDGVLVPDDDDVSDDADDDDDGGDGDLVPEQPFLPDLKQQPSIKVTDFTEMICS